MNHTIAVDGVAFDGDIRHFSFPAYHQIRHMEELQKLASFPNLDSADFGGTNLDDLGLEYVTRAAELQELNLQNTAISNGSLALLARLPYLYSLRLKDNPQLTNACVPHLLGLPELAELQIHETAIDQQGLEALAGMAQLREIIISVADDNYAFERLLALSEQMAHCIILAKGHGEFSSGDSRDSGP